MSDDEVQILDDQRSVPQPFSHSNGSGHSLFPPSHQLQFANNRSFYTPDQYETNVMRMKGNIDTLKGQLKDIHLFLLAGEDMLYYMEQYKDLVKQKEDEHQKTNDQLQKILTGHSNEDMLNTILKTHEAYEDIRGEVEPLNSTIEDFVLECNNALRSSVDSMKELKTSLELQFDLKKMAVTLKEGMSIYKRLKDQSGALQDMLCTARARTRANTSGRQTKMDFFAPVDSKASSKTSPHFKQQTSQARMVSKLDEDDHEYFVKESSGKSKSKLGSSFEEYFARDDDDDDDDELEAHQHNSNVDRKLEMMNTVEDVDVDSCYPGFQRTSVWRSDRRTPEECMGETVSGPSSEEDRPKSKDKRTRDEEEEWNEDDDWMDSKSGSKKTAAPKKKRATPESHTPPTSRSSRKSTTSSSKALPLPVEDGVIDLS